MKASTRLYFNLTNKCNLSCDFCCMYSEPSKSTFLSFESFKTIIDSTKDYFELQLEGGESFLHDDFYLFLEYAKHTKRCSKVVISTNGILLNKNLQRLTDFCDFSKIPVLIKRSINYHLYDIDNSIFKKCRDLYLTTEFIEGLDVKFNVRLRKEDGWVIDKLREFKIFDQSNIYEFQNYGRLEDGNYSKPFIVQNIDNWFIYSCDGKCFDQDLIRRSEYEKTLK
jgi:MoaA/NifB/PqqE/SkfB family radical SAM enzyme